MSQPIAPPNRVHMKLKYTGSARKIALFDFIAGNLDLDFPYAPVHLRRGYPDNLEKLDCVECNGVIYRTPNLDPETIKILAKQVSDTTRISGALKIKVKKYTKNPKCTLVPDDPDDDLAVNYGYCG